MSALPVDETPEGCGACSAPTDTYLCGRCVSELRAILTSLYRGPWITAVNGNVASGGRWAIERPTPGLLEHLGEAAIGKVRMNTSRSRRSRVAGVMAYADPKPATDGLGGTEGQRRLEQDAENGRLTVTAVLKQGRINTKATDLIDKTNRTLTDFVDAASRHGVKPPPQFAAIPRNSLPGTMDMAVWLASHTGVVTVMRDAGQWYERIDNLRRCIEKVIDRPEPLRTCGPCPTLIDRQECGTALEAKPDQREVTCPRCEQTYDVEHLINDLVNRSDDMLVTIRELVDWVLPKLDEPVPQKTLEGWVNRGWVPLRGHNDSGALMVRLGDVREVRRNRPRHKRAG